MARQRTFAEPLCGPPGRRLLFRIGECRALVAHLAALDCVRAGRLAVRKTLLDLFISPIMRRVVAVPDERVPITHAVPEQLRRHDSRTRARPLLREGMTPETPNRHREGKDGLHPRFLAAARVI